VGIVKIVRHRLRDDDGDEISFRGSPNQSAGLEPEFLVMHYTAGSSAESSIDWLTNPAARASAHVVVGRDGSVTQLVPFNRRAWHAGLSQWENRTGLNRWSLGIELDNMGALERHVDGWYSAWGSPVDDSEVMEATHRNGGLLRGWHTFSPEQLHAAAEVANLLVRQYGLRDVVGHDEIAPARKTDPGPAFPMESFRARVIGRGGDSEAARAQTTTALHIRIGPGTQFPKLESSPLSAGTKVQVLDSEAAWRHVLVLDVVAGDMDVEGWVHGRYLDAMD
jgi:N-acetylmuramoyl-L-alanine amidase